MVTGRKAQDRDALLSFVGGQVTVLNRQGGAILATTSYQAIERATYVRARNPKWDPVLFSPPPDLDMPGILPTARHWLVLQGKAAYLILQLDGDNWLKVLETVESPEVRALPVAAGGVEQQTDNIDILSRTGRRRALARAASALE